MPYLPMLNLQENVPIYPCVYLAANHSILLSSHSSVRLFHLLLSSSYALSYSSLLSFFLTYLFLQLYSTYLSPPMYIFSYLPISSSNHLLSYAFFPTRIHPYLSLFLLIFILTYPYLYLSSSLPIPPSTYTHPYLFTSSSHNNSYLSPPIVLPTFTLAYPYLYLYSPLPIPSSTYTHHCLAPSSSHIHPYLSSILPTFTLTYPLPTFTLT